MDASERKALDDIERYGCHVIHVMAEADLPPFSYSVGIWKSAGVPELIVVGLKQPLAHFIVNEYNRRIRDGERFAPGKVADGFVEGFPCIFQTVDRTCYGNYLGWDLWFHGDDRFDALQLIYPTTAGIWPWEPLASDWFRDWQTLRPQA